MAHGRAHPHAIEVIRRCHAQTGGMQAILVVGGAEPRLYTGRVECLLDRRRGTRLTAPDRNRSVRTVAIIILDVEIALRFPKEGHDLVIRPFIVAESRPGIEILGKTPLHRLTVDGRTPA